MAKIIGIDLGTTNSVVAVMEGGSPTVIPTAEGGNLVPSVVAFKKNGERLVGQTAKRQAVVNPENTVFSIKRFMGRRFDEVDAERKMVPYQMMPGPKDDARVKIPNTNKTYTPQEISAMILGKLKTDAEAYLGEPVTQGGDHRAGLLQRQPAPGHQGRRQDRRPGSAAHHQRADRRRAGLWPGQEEERNDPGLRPGRRHLRRDRARSGRRRDRGEVHQRRHAPGRRRLGCAWSWTG